MTMTHSPSSSSKPTPPAGDRSGGSKQRRPSSRRSRGAHDPSLLHEYIESSKRKDERKRDERRKSSRPSVKTRRTSVEFRGHKSNLSSDGYDDADTHASSDHASSFISLSSTKIFYDDNRSASGLFPVKGTTSLDSGVEHWRAAESATCSHTTNSASTTHVDNRTYPATHPHRGRRRSHRSPTSSQASSGFLELPYGGDLDDASESSSDYGVFVSDESSAGSASSGGSEGSSILWDHIEKRGRHTRHSGNLSKSSKSLESSLNSKERKRLKSSAMKVARGFAQVVAGAFALSSLLIYLAFQADFKSILDDVASTKSNFMGRMFGNDLVEAEKKLADSPLLRSRTLPQAYIRQGIQKVTRPEQKTLKPQTTKRVFKEADESAIAREQYLRVTRQAYQHMASGPARGQTRSPREEASTQEQARTSGQTASGTVENLRKEAKTVRTQKQHALDLRQRMLSDRAKRE